MSSALDEDTQQTLAEGRETAGAMLRAAQKDLQKVFVLFVVGFMGTFYALRTYVWEFLKDVTKARLNSVTAEEVNIIVQTPFDVVLLQAKIGLAVGIVFALPLFIYFARDPLRERGAWPEAPVARWKLALIALAAGGLFVVGVTYGYLVFFPFMFAFLANNALSAGIQPNYSIVKWAQFILLLTFSFGFAAQMPLAITALSYAEIVPYETFREKWRYAVALIFVFGAFFSPPDPFTQVMWAVPLLVLYGASLYLAKVVVTARRGSERIDAGATFRRHWNVIAALSVAAAAAVYLFYAQGGPAVVNGVAPYVTDYRMLPLATTTVYALAAVAALLVAVSALAYYVYAELDAASGATGRVGDPTAIDLSTLDETGVRAAPSEAFETMREAEALAAAQTAIDAGEKGKARAILDRWDETDQGERAAERDRTTGSGTGTESTASLDEEDGMVAMVKRGHRRVDWPRRLRERWHLFVGAALLCGLVAYLTLTNDVWAWVNYQVLPYVPFVEAGAILNVETYLGLADREAAVLVASLGTAVASGVALLVYYVQACLRAAMDPAAGDLSELTPGELRWLPASVFAEMRERDVVREADRARQHGAAERARLILDRYDEAVPADPEGGPRRDLLAGDDGLVAAARRGAGLVDWRGRFGSVWNGLLAVAVLVFAAGYLLVERPALADRVLADFGTDAASLTAALPVSGTAALALFAVAGILLAVLLGAALALYIAYSAGTDPEAVDVEALTADEVRRAPDALFAGISERRANFLADRAASAGDSAKARAVLDRYDGAERAREAAASEAGGGSGSAPDPGAVPGTADDIGDRTSRATGTLLEGLTDGESDEDDIGGYYEDLAFIASALRSRAFVLVAVFGIVLVTVFASLYLGGIGVVRESFVSRLPEQVVGPDAENFAVIVLHPVEALIFEVKISTLLAGVATLPVAAFYAWPALRERGFVRGRRGVIFGWIAALVVGLFGGLAVGAYYVAPAVISWLVGDALRAGMVISYRISDFFWLVFFTTVGIGLLADIPVLMVLLNSVGVSYRSLRSRWREVTVGLMLFAALFTPADVITMFLVTVPLMAAYGVGLGILFVLTLGGRRDLAEPTVDLTRD